MKKILLYVTIILVSAFAKAQDQQWTLQECVQYAIDQNITIKQNILDQEGAKIDKSDAIGAMLPSLNASASNSWNTGLTQNIVTGILETQTSRNSSYSINAGVRIFGGMRNVKTLDRAELTRIAADYNLEQLKDDIALNVAVSFLNVLLAKESLKVIEEQNTVTKTQIQRTTDLVDGGVLPRGDLLEIRATDASEQQRIVAAQNAVKVALLNLAQLLNLDDFENFDIADQQYNIIGEEVMKNDPELIIAKAKETRYDIKIAEQNIEIAKKDLEISKGAYLPTLDGFFGYSTRESDRGGFAQAIDEENPFETVQIGTVEDTGQSVITDRPNTLLLETDPRDFIDQLYRNDGISYGLSLNIPIFNGWRVRNQVKRGELNVERLQLQKEQTALNLETAVYQAYVDAKAARESYTAAQTALASQELAFDYAKERYDVGLTNAFDFSQSKLRLDSAQIELARSKYDYIFRIKVLELYFGIEPADLKF